MCLVNTEDKLESVYSYVCVCLYTTFQSLRFVYVIERRLVLIHLIKNTVRNSKMQYCEILLQFKTTVFFFIYFKM